MDDAVTAVLGLAAILLPISGALLRYLLKNENRMTRVETKIDGLAGQVQSLATEVNAVVRHLGLNPGPREEREEEP